MKKIAIEKGQKVYFDPFDEPQYCFGAEALRGNAVEGTVDYINEKCGWFSVVYGKLRTSFFFNDIGKKVFNERENAKRALRSV